MSEATINQAPPAHSGALAALRWISARRPRGFLPSLGIAIVAAILVLVFVVPFFANLDPYKFSYTAQLKPPSWAHPFGTDELGRDYFARVLIGGRVSILVGLAIVALAAAIGVTFGAVAGFSGGVVDEVLMRIAEIFLAFPRIILALIIAGALGPSVRNAVIAIAAGWWPAYARLVRGQVLTIREREYVAAARSVGGRERKILFRTVLPNSLAPLKVVFLLDVGPALVAAATLSFFGLGVREPKSEWGLLIQEAITQPGAWWLVVIPGLAITLFAAGLNFATGHTGENLFERR